MEVIVPGPKIVTYKSCLSCDKIESNLIKTGMNPIREYKCSDENISERDPLYVKGYLGTDENGDVETPDWCPYLNKQP
jgi:hypothetical protein